ncbi:RPM1-interacting protein 4 [Cajanus cajan]|uniref:RPM1-interacting protein 4 n=1 Tax=Cajanus cajan TaxID=3821 RepID=UPI00098D84E9|nr:RPM1-interacting protein 4 [Cajanus cajan]
MAQRSHVPKFGNWDSGDNVPYTAYFDKARKGRTGARIINPNDPEENSDLSAENLSSDQLPPSKPRVFSEDPPRKVSLHSEDDPKHFIDSPARHDNAGSRSGSRSHGVGSAENRRRPSTQSTGSEFSIDRSPLHRQARAPGRDSPQWEGKNSYESSQGTPGRSRFKPRGDETPDKGAAVPKFGDWDVNNPASADGFTHIFNKVREEKQGGPGQVQGTPERPQVIRGKPTNDKVQCCCFGWGKN